MDGIPRLKKALITHKLNIGVNREDYECYMMLKEKYGINTAQYMRDVFTREMKRLREMCEELPKD